MSVPYWRHARSPREISCDVAVIGGGITGVAAALALEQRGINAILIERHEIASGASGRNAGYLMRGAADNYAAAVRTMGRDAARHLWRWTEDNLAMLRAAGIKSLASYQRVPSCLLAFDETEAAELRTSRTLMDDDGFHTGWSEYGTDAPWRNAKPRCALINPNDAACNPHELLAFLAAKLRAAPLIHQEISGIDIEAGRVTLRAADLRVSCTKCLICTNAYAPLLLPDLARLVVPRRGQMLAIRTRRPEFDYAYYANHGSEYFRQVTPNAAVVGGWRTHFAKEETGFEDHTTPEVQSGLESFAASLLGESPEVISRWAGTMGFTPDGLPLVGPIDELGRVLSEPGPLWFCGGYTGHGMSMAYRTAHAAVEAMLGSARDAEAGEMPFPLARALGGA